jgi:hypothetical protein
MVRASRSGHFRANLAPGRYWPTPAPGYGTASFTGRPIQVPKRGFATADVGYDMGIG